MKLVASMIVAPIEVDRYLYPCLDHLLTFCDHVMIAADGPDVQIDFDGRDADRVAVWWLPAGSFYQHEGKARQQLLDLTQQLNPTHVLAIDADEFVSDGEALRASCESECPVLTLNMQEVWGATISFGLTVRQDGGWREHPVPIVWQAPPRLTTEWRIRDQALACGREPEAVRAYQRRDCFEPSGIDVLHFGWANQADRQRRYDRYVAHDNGRFHNRAHLDSIMWRDDQVTLTERPWPPALADYSHDILKVANP